MKIVKKRKKAANTPSNTPSKTGKKKPKSNKKANKTKAEKKTRSNTPEKTPINEAKPKRKRNLYTKDHPARALEFLKNGFTKAALAGEFGISRQAMHKWENKYPEFKAATDQGLLSAQKFYEQRLLLLASGSSGATPEIEEQNNEVRKKTNITALIFLMKTRFYKDFGDVMKHQGTIEHNIESKTATKMTIEFVKPKRSENDDEEILEIENKSADGSGG